MKILAAILFFTTIFTCSCNENKKSASDKFISGVIADQDSSIENVTLITSVQEEVAMKRKPRPTQPPTTNPPPPVIVLPPPPITIPIDSSNIVMTKTTTVFNQAGDGSCVGQAVAAMVTITKMSQRLSPAFIYNQSVFDKTNCNIGTSMQMALDVVVGKGCCTNDLMPYVTNQCSVQPNLTQLTEALQYKINGYSKILSTDTSAIKTLINQGKPVLLTVLADNDFINAKAGYVWNTDGAGALPHCILIVGYNKTKNTFIIMNSLGTAWCNNGYGEISFSLFGKVTGTYCYVIN